MSKQVDEVKHIIVNGKRVTLYSDYSGHVAATEYLGKFEGSYHTKVHNCAVCALTEAVSVILDNTQ